MDLKHFASELKANDNFIKAVFGGFSGAGKTRTASEFIKGVYSDFNIKKPLLMIDNEKGHRFLIPFFKEAGIETYVKNTTSLADVIIAFELLNKGEIGFLFIDSLTKIWYEYVEDYRKANRKKFLTIQDWGNLKPTWHNKFNQNFLDVNGCCVFTGRGGYEYNATEDDNGKLQFVRSGVKTKVEGETAFEPDLNIWMERKQDLDKDGNKVWREATIWKDRSGLIDGKTFIDPTYKDFRPVVKYLVSVEVSPIYGVSDASNLAPTEDYEKADRKRQREIELENIKAEFDKSNLGRGDRDKQLKIAILEKIFGLKSWTAIEGMPFSNLINCRKELEKFMMHFIDAEDQKAYIDNYKPENNFDLTDDPISEIYNN